MPRSTVTIDPECQEGINRDTPGLDRGTRSSVMGKIIAVAARHRKDSWLFDPQIGCQWLSRLNHLSLVSVVDR